MCGKLSQNNIFVAFRKFYENYKQNFIFNFTNEENVAYFSKIVGGRFFDESLLKNWL